METTIATQSAPALMIPKAYLPLVRKYHATMGALTLEGVTAYLADLGKTARAATVTVTKYALQAAILSTVHDARAQEMIRAAFRRIKTPRADRTIHHETILSAEQIQALTVADASPRARLLVRVLSATGTRLSEALGMKKADCEVDGDLVRVRIMGKGMKERRVFLPLGLYLEVLHTFNGDTFLFSTATGKAIHSSAARGMVYAVARAAGVKGVHPHSFRHTWATAQLKMGRTLKAVSRYLGHASTSITADYYDSNELTAREALGVA
jgi:integrase/recombinase XerD